MNGATTFDLIFSIYHIFVEIEVAVIPKVLVMSSTGLGGLLLVGVERLQKS